MLAHLLTTSGDLPIPAWLFAWGASMVLVVSFFGLAAAWRVPKFEQDHWRRIAPKAFRWMSAPAVCLLCGVIGLVLLAGVIYAGLAGTETPGRNFSVTFVFVTVWIGGPVLSAIAGNVLAAFNPWRSLGLFAGWLVEASLGHRPGHLAYPVWLGRWPAAISFVAFVWLEIVYGSELGGVVLTPRIVATAAIIYTAFTFSMMILFGTRAWCRNGELFSVLFGMFSTLSPFEPRDRRMGRRRALSGTTNWAGRHGSTALVLAAIAGTTYDGAQQGMLLGFRESLARAIGDSGASELLAARAVDTTMLFMTWVLVTAVYSFGIWGMRRLPESPSFRVLRIAFSHSLIPIALAYLLAHYFSYFVERMQAQFTFLLSDPLGRGSDVIGLSDVQVGSGFFSTAVVWYAQLAFLLGGHVIGLMLAHDRSLTIWQNVRVAARSQYWMLAVMVFLTVFGLFLLSATNG